MNNRCVGINYRGKRCERHSHDLCKECGNPVCHFHEDKDKHNCDALVLGEEQ